uniref:Putative secreted protein n=1 Tax=Anopheles marajoara TaxID=58244 RepID=A0A2M4CEC8_9DIPT
MGKCGCRLLFGLAVVLVLHGFPGPLPGVQNPPKTTTPRSPAVCLKLRNPCVCGALSKNQSGAAAEQSRNG